MNNLKIFSQKLIITLCIFIFTISMGSSFSVQAISNPPELNSKGYSLIDATTGQVLHSQNGDTKYFPASTTKIITAMIVLENANLSDSVTVGKNPPFADGTSIGLREGEVYTVEELLLGLILESGNDCAEALAEHVSGSKEAFAELMNKKAKEVGAINSNFTNPSGLPDDNHYTTPNDLALLMREAIKNPDFIRIARVSSQKMQPSTVDGYERWVNNHNYIINPNSSYYYPYAVASKKGYTTVAHFTNIISAEKDGKTFVASFLDGEGMEQVYGDVKKLFDYGFDNFDTKKLYSEGDTVASISVGDSEIPLIATKDIYYSYNLNDTDSLNPTIEYDTPRNIRKKSINKGDTLTKGNVLVNGQKIDTMDLLSGSSREYVYENSLTTFYKNNKIAIQAAIIIIGICLVLTIISTIKRDITRKKRSRIIQSKKIKKPSERITRAERNKKYHKKKKNKKKKK